MKNQVLAATKEKSFKKMGRYVVRESALAFTTDGIPAVPSVNGGATNHKH